MSRKALTVLLVALALLIAGILLDQGLRIWANASLLCYSCIGIG